MPATSEKLGEFLGESSPWTPGEKWVIKWQFGLLGNFNGALAKAISLADENNRLRSAGLDI